MNTILDTLTLLPSPDLDCWEESWQFPRNQMVGDGSSGSTTTWACQHLIGDSAISKSYSVTTTKKQDQKSGCPPNAINGYWNDGLQYWIWKHAACAICHFGASWVKIDNVEYHIHSQGLWACVLLQGLNYQVCILKEVALFGLKLMNRVMFVQTKCDCNNLAADNLTPPVMPHELVNLKPCDFIDNVLEKYQAQLVKSLPIDEINCIERAQQAFYNAYRWKHHTQTIINNQNHTMFFNKGWDALGADCFGGIVDILWWVG